ncbi:MAG: hypothetical protein LC113_08335 [Acidobacteria bacterium]|nr:hypothetical protein [Acidobacteriota bacterium]
MYSYLVLITGGLQLYETADILYRKYFSNPIDFEGLSLAVLRRSHRSRPCNPLIADACFEGGYIDAWGRGTPKIINAGLEAELPKPEIVERDGGVQVTLCKNRFTEETGLSARQIRVVEHALRARSISNS